MVQSCVVVGCTNRWQQGSKVSWHRFPTDTDPVRRRLWLNSVNRKEWAPKSSDRVCGKHFLSGCGSTDPLSPDYFPTVDMGYISTKFKTPDLKAERHNRSEERKRRQSEHEYDVQSRNQAASVLMDLSSLYNNTFSDCMADTEDSPPKENLHAKCQEDIAVLHLEKTTLLAELRSLRLDNKKLRQDRDQAKFGINQLNSNYKISFYTGVPTIATLLWIIDFLKDSIPSL